MELRKLPRGKLVYVLQAHNGLLKFGSSRHLRSRLSGIQATSPDPIICVAWAEGSVLEELALHVRLIEHHHHSEWFLPAPEVLKVVANFKRIVGVIRREHLALGVDRFSLDSRYRAAKKTAAALRTSKNDHTSRDTSLRAGGAS